MFRDILCRFGNFEEILGLSRPGLPPAIYSPCPPDTAVLSHEQTHVSLNCGSTHGMYLTLVANLYRYAPPTLPRKQHKALRRKFKALLSCCRFVQEGCATAVELNYVIALQGNDAPKRMLDCLPRFYRHALNRFKPVVLSFLEKLSETAGDASGETLNIAIEGIARACMNTSIFESFGSPEAFWDHGFDFFLSLPRNSPDERLQKLAEYVSKQSGFGDTLVSRLKRSGVIDRMKQLPAPSHLETMRQRFILSKSIIRICGEVVQEANLFPIDDIISRDNREFLRKVEILNSALYETVGVKGSCKYFEMEVEDYPLPTVYVRHSSLRASKSMEQLSTAALINRLRERQSQHDSGTQPCLAMYIWPRPNDDRINCETVQMKIQRGEAGMERITDGTEDENLPSFLSSLTAGELVEVTRTLAEYQGIIATHSLAWRLFHETARSKLPAEASVPIFVYTPVMTVRLVEKWATTENETLCVNIVTCFSSTIEDGEVHRGGIVLVGPLSGRGLVRFGLLASSDHEDLLKQAITQSGLKLNPEMGQLWDTQVKIAYWAAVKYLASLQFHDDRWLT